MILNLRRNADVSKKSSFVIFRGYYRHFDFQDPRFCPSIIYQRYPLKCNRIFTNHFHILRQWSILSSIYRRCYRIIRCSIRENPDPSFPSIDLIDHENVSLLHEHHHIKHALSLLNPLTVVQSLKRPWSTLYRVTRAGTGNGTTDRDCNETTSGTSIVGMRKRASYEAGRTFVQDGFDARTGDEREPREPTLAKGGGRGWEGISTTSGKSEREAQSEIVRRPTKWRKGERERPNGASLSSATGLRNTHIVRPFHCIRNC